jgi:hypothetical protein
MVNQTTAIIIAVIEKEAFNKKYNARITVSIKTMFM